VGAAALRRALSVGWLDPQTWEVLDGERPGAVRVDPRVLDSAGEAAWVSLSLGPPLPFDDAAVSGALRRYLAGPSGRAVTTLLVSDVLYVGALVVGDSKGELYEDPFALVYPRRLLRVDAGVFGRQPHPPGPGIARYRGAWPWPWDEF
jgi:hypothetical protein